MACSEWEALAARIESLHALCAVSYLGFGEMARRGSATYQWRSGECGCVLCVCRARATGCWTKCSRCRWPSTVSCRGCSTLLATWLRSGLMVCCLPQIPAAHSFAASFCDRRSFNYCAPFFFLSLLNVLLEMSICLSFALQLVSCCWGVVFEAVLIGHFR